MAKTKSDEKKGVSENSIIQKKNKATGKTEWYARIVRFDGNGQKKQIVEKAESKSHARRLRDELREKYDTRGENAITGDKMLFRELCEHYEREKLFAAQYQGAGAKRRKIAGVASLVPAQCYLRTLKTHFGAKHIRFITHSDVERFKLERLATPTKHNRERSVSDVNHSLTLLRAIFRFAITKSWLLESPFTRGKPIISTADENRRDRILSFDEERRLLDVCLRGYEKTYTRQHKNTGKPETVTVFMKSRRRHLVPIIYTAVETAMRRGELLKLRWRDVDFIRREIRILATNTKTARARVVPITDVVFDQLQNLWANSPQDVDQLVFGFTDSVNTSFKNACRDAGINDLNFHDLRHSAITRMIEAGMPPMQIMAISGHTQMNTFARYVNADSNTVQRIAAAMNSLRAAVINDVADSKFIN